MIDPKTYIENGILELYVLGDLSGSERHEVEEMAAKYPAIKSELEAIQYALEAYALQNGLKPPQNARSKFLSAVNLDDSQHSVPLNTYQTASRGSFYKYAFAASVALLLISVVMLINLNNRLQESNTQLAALQSANQQFTNRVNFMEQRLETARQSLEIYQNPEQYRIISLKGSPKAPDARMMVAFNSVRQEVMIDMSSLRMPKTDNAHSYQLWALVDGKPVDLGVFESAPGSAGMKRMKSVKGADAFAVTLEPKGGSVNPTLEQMMAIGNI